MKNRQLPGRREALRNVLANGLSNSDEALKKLAGFGNPRHPAMQSQPMPVVTFSCGLSDEELKSLPF